MNIEDDIQFLKGVGPALAERFKAIGIANIKQLLWVVPYRYEDRSRPDNVADIPHKSGEHILLRGKVSHVEIVTPRPRFSIMKVFFRDEMGQEFTAVWFNQKYLLSKLTEDSKLLISGKVTFNTFENSYEVTVEDFEFIGGMASAAERVIPFYRLTEGLNQKKYRAVVQSALQIGLPLLPDWYPDDFRKQHGLLKLTTALGEMHFPTTRLLWKQSHDRLVFDEFFFMQLALAVRKVISQQNIKGISFNVDGDLVSNYESGLPYKLTAAQQRTLAEIKTDMQIAKPMNRMLQGDVGSGKTDVAIAALLCAVQSGYQAAIMVPTEVLARQHYNKMVGRLEQLGVKVLLLVGSQGAKQKQELYQQISAQQVDIVVGTHALIQGKVNFAKLGLVIIDEQHRFGVMQRNLLKEKSKLMPDLLVMTATPIPRSLSLTAYGDLEVSIIDEMPPGRVPIETYHVPQKDRARMYQFCLNQLAKGQQVYIVYPLVEESEKLDLKAAVESYEYLSQQVFSDYPVGLLHGRMKDVDKDLVMQKFRGQQLKVLVSTTVIEVGVDVPTATIMIVEDATRFGLSQLHQLRGRVGRGDQKSYCFLVGQTKSPEARKRIKTMVDTTDGFKIAQVDLEIRGPGDFLGVRQSGLPDLNVADLLKDDKILHKARDIAFGLINQDRRLLNYPSIKSEVLKRCGTWLRNILLN